MSQQQAFTIEVYGRSAGIVVAERGRFTFFASDRAFREIDRRVFRRIQHAERAARDLLVDRNRA